MGFLPFSSSRRVPVMDMGSLSAYSAPPGTADAVGAAVVHQRVHVQAKSEARSFDQITDKRNREMLEARGMGPRGGKMQGRFELGFTTPDNAQLWGLSDLMSIDAAASWMQRRIFRMRSRQAYHNNAYYKHMVRVKADYVIGTGPRLQLLTDNKKFNQAGEQSFAAWAKAICLARKLKSDRMARIYNGEGFALLRNNPRIPHPVKLDFFEIEADQVSSPYFGQYPSAYADQYFDGKMLDPWGNPVVYHVLRQHPGAFGAFVIMGYEFDPWPAKFVWHSYRRERPGQQRGIPEMLPAIQLLEEIRTFGAAVRSAAERAADYAVIIETQQPANTEPDAEYGCQPWDLVPMRRDQMMTLPVGSKASQMKAEQPSTQFEMFVNMNLREAAVSADMPLFMASLDAKGMNMSIAYTITQPFVKAVQGDREEYNSMLSQQLLPLWMAEWARVGEYQPMAGLDVQNIPHVWHWDRIAWHADPAKVSTANETNLAMGTVSSAEIIAENGGIPEQVQQAEADFLGMTLDDYKAAVRQRRFATRGNPQPETLLPEPDTGEETDPAQVGESGAGASQEGTE